MGELLLLRELFLAAWDRGASYRDVSVGIHQWVRRHRAPDRRCLMRREVVTVGVGTVVAAAAVRVEWLKGCLPS